MIDIYMAMSAAAITVLICTASITAWPRKWVRKLPVVGNIIECPFCTSWWVTAAVVLNYVQPRDWGWLLYLAAEVAITSIFILLIHLSMMTVAGSDDAEA